MAWIIGATKHGNWHVVVEIYNNITFVVNYLVAKKAFEETLGCDSEDNVKNTNINLFQKKTIALVEGIPLQNYICQA